MNATLLSPRERLMLSVMVSIVKETMDRPPGRAVSADSYLPPLFIETAQSVLELYGQRVNPKAMTA